MASPHPPVPAGPCAGDVTPAEAWERLAADPAAVLVDVRTRIELALTGGPDPGPLRLGSGGRTRRRHRQALTG